MARVRTMSNDEKSREVVADLLASPESVAPTEPVSEPAGRLPVADPALYPVANYDWPTIPSGILPFNNNKFIRNHGLKPGSQFWLSDDEVGYMVLCTLGENNKVTVHWAYQRAIVFDKDQDCHNV